jgi:hypothetical protein
VGGDGPGEQKYGNQPPPRLRQVPCCGQRENPEMLPTSVNCSLAARDHNTRLRRCGKGRVPRAESRRACTPPRIDGPPPGPAI